MRLSLFCSSDHLIFGGIRIAVHDVFTCGAIEHRGFLRDHSDLPTQRFLRDRLHVNTVD